MGPKKRKAQPHNAFYYFMIERQTQLENSGRRFPRGLKDVADLVSPEWNHLSDEDKRPYELKARREKGGEKYTTVGETYSEVDQKLKEKEARIEAMKQFIAHTLIAHGRNTGLPTAPFFLMHLNYYCQREEDFYLAEVAITKYSIMDGVDQDKVFHTFVDLGPLPLGLAHKAQLVSNDTHMIPSPPLPDHLSPERCPESLFSRIVSYLNAHLDDADSEMLPPLYTLEKLIPSAESILTKLAVENRCHQQDFFRVYSLEELFFQMKNFSLKPTNERLCINGTIDNGFPFKSVAVTMIEDDKYNYRPHIACVFHEEMDRVTHCSRSYVIRWTWHISNNLCANLDVEMKLHRHCPGDTDVRELVRPQPCHTRVAANAYDGYDEAVGGIPLVSSTGSGSEHDYSLKSGDNPWQTSTGRRAGRDDDIQPLRKKKTQSVALSLSECPDLGKAGAFFSDLDFPAIGAVALGRGSSRRLQSVGRGYGRHSAASIENSLRSLRIQHDEDEDEGAYDDDEA